MLRLGRPSFTFLDPGRLVDGELELVEPHKAWVDDLLAGCRHPETVRLEPDVARTHRDQIIDFLTHCPRGRQRPDPAAGIVPAYHFWMRCPPGSVAPTGIVGSIALRVAETEDIELYLGHVGYNVLPPARGHRLAARATRLILPLARRHGMRRLWVTTNPDNIASRRTIEHAGGVLVDVVSLPPAHPLRARGESDKCRYRLDL